MKLSRYDYDVDFLSDSGEQTNKWMSLCKTVASKRAANMVRNKLKYND